MKKIFLILMSITSFSLCADDTIEESSLIAKDIWVVVFKSHKNTNDIRLEKAFDKNYRFQENNVQLYIRLIAEEKKSLDIFFKQDGIYTKGFTMKNEAVDHALLIYNNENAYGCYSWGSLDGHIQADGDNNRTLTNEAKKELNTIIAKAIKRRNNKNHITKPMDFIYPQAKPMVIDCDKIKISKPLGKHKRAVTTLSNKTKKAVITLFTSPSSYSHKDSRIKKITPQFDVDFIKNGKNIVSVDLIPNAIESYTRIQILWGDLLDDKAKTKLEYRNLTLEAFHKLNKLLEDEMNAALKKKATKEQAELEELFKE